MSLGAAEALFQHAAGRGLLVPRYDPAESAEVIQAGRGSAPGSAPNCCRGAKEKESQTAAWKQQRPPLEACESLFIINSIYKYDVLYNEKFNESCILTYNVFNICICCQ